MFTIKNKVMSPENKMIDQKLVRQGLSNYPKVSYLESKSTQL